MTWWEHNRASAYMPILGLDTGGVMPELKLRLRFYYSWSWYISFFLFNYFSACLFLILFFCLFTFSWWFFCCFFACLFCYYGFSIFISFPTIFFLSILSTLPSSFSHPYCHPLHSPSFSWAKICCSLSQQLILPLLTHSLPLPSPSSPFLPQPVTHHTHHPLTNLQYQLYTIPDSWNPWHKHPPLLQQKYTQTHTRTTKTRSPHAASPTQQPHFPSPPLVPPYPTPQISIASLTNVNPQLPLLIDVTTKVSSV
jgi:hypothetical protein